MKIQQFNKAAKRYSLDASIPLSTAQEKLSTFFGHKNYALLQRQLNEPFVFSVTKKILTRMCGAIQQGMNIACSCTS